MMTLLPLFSLSCLLLPIAPSNYTPVCPLPPSPHPTSSIIMMLYDARSGSPRNSRSSMPSVMYLISVLSLVQSSNRME